MSEITTNEIVPAVKATQVHKAFGNLHVLKGIDMTVMPGTVTVILGPSGSGKSTFLRLINQLETLTGGEIDVDGEMIGYKYVDKGGERVLQTLNDKEVAEQRSKLGMVFQRFNLFPHMTALENVMEAPVHVKHMDKKEARELAIQELNRVGMGERLDYYPAQLSGGQQQRVAIARTLAPEPTVLFMDEPLSNLDAKLRLEMRSELQRLHIDTGSTFIYVTHDQMEAMTLATKICLIENGVLQQYDAPLDVYAKPNNVFVADFVGNPAINFIDASGAQQSDGTLTLSALDGMQLSFRPKEPLDVAAWYERADAEDKARRDAENARALDKKSVEKGNKDVLFRYHVARVNETEDFGDEAALTDGDFVLGVRPEFLRLSDSGAIEGEIYSAMPTGMETTVKVRVGSFLLTGVVFGGVLYRIGQKIRLDFQGDGVVLFSRRNGRMIAQGSLSVK